MSKDDFNTDLFDMEDQYYEQDIRFNRCLHEIRNMKLLNKEMLKTIREMSHEQKMLVIKTYNLLLERMVEFLEDQNEPSYKTDNSSNKK